MKKLNVAQMELVNGGLCPGLIGRKVGLATASTTQTRMLGITTSTQAKSTEKQ